EQQKAAAPGENEVPDPVEMRRLAFLALRQLILRLARWRPLVMVIDDLQWADADSFVLLGELLRPPEPPPFLLLATVRTTTASEEKSERPALSTLPGEVRHLHIEKLLPEDARELVGRLLGAEAQPLGMADEIVREAQGHPLFIDELVRLRREREAEGEG